MRLLQKFLARFGYVPANRRVEAIRRDVLRITLDEFRDSGPTVLAAQQILKNPAFLNLLDVMQGHIVHLLTQLSAYPDDRQRLAQADMLFGYAKALNDLKSMGDPAESETCQEPSFLTDEDEERFAKLQTK